MDTTFDDDLEDFRSPSDSIDVTLFTNCSLSSSNCTMTAMSATSARPHDMPASGLEPWQVALTSVACGIIIIGTIVGNILVCTAVAIVRRLRTPSNLLIVSLAVSDLLVAILVMPFATIYEIMGRWDLGQDVCDMWTLLDVFLCTASILNLCAISIDRYFVITRPFQYAMKRTPVRMAVMIVFVWILSALISIPPLIGGKTGSEKDKCAISQAIWYQFYATIGAFYLPLGVMIVIYTRIYLVSSRIASAEARAKPVIGGNSSGAAVNQFPTSGSATPLRKESAAVSSVDRVSVPTLNNSAVARNGHGCGVGRSLPGGRDSTLGGELLQSSTSGSGVGDHQRHQRRFRLFGKSRLNRISASNERKATKTLGVIMGAFTACWLPFFILALIKPFCRQDTCIPNWLSSLFLWLGYANSFLNPIIYARFNRDFRTPFKHILQCHVRDINTRLRSENYAEQFGRIGGAGSGCGGGGGFGMASSATGVHFAANSSAPPRTVIGHDAADLALGGVDKNGIGGDMNPIGDECTNLCPSQEIGIRTDDVE